MERGVELTVAVDSLSFFISSLRVFRQDAQTPKKIKVSFFFRKRREVSRVKPSLQRANLPEPILELYLNQFSRFLGHISAAFCLFCHD